MTTYFIYRNFYDPQQQRLMLGGIENYIYALAQLLRSQGQRCVVVQTAKQNFQAEFQGIEILGVNCKGYHGNRKKLALFEKVKSVANPASDTVIFATDSYFVANDFSRSVAIQHGVSWDKPAAGSGFWHGLKRYISHYKYLNYIKDCKNLVCVDHNFVNWYRTYQSFPAKMNVEVILNFSPALISPEQFDAKWQQPLAQPSLLIARRFVDYRGIPLAIAVVKKLLQSHPELKVSFAGEGPLEQEIRHQLKDYPQVDIFRYQATESVEVHQRYDLVLLPSVGSEGSSLSLAEALSAGCAVVTTNVGGLSNMVIDQSNGLVAMPEVDALVAKLKLYLEQPQFAKQMAQQGYYLARQSFSLSRWQQQWLDYLATLPHP